MAFPETFQLEDTFQINMRLIFKNHKNKKDIHILLHFIYFNPLAKLVTVFTFMCMIIPCTRQHFS